MLYVNSGKKLRSDGRGELDRACDSGQWIVIDSKVLSSETSLITFSTGSIMQLTSILSDLNSLRACVSP